MATFTGDIGHIAGQDNVVADTLSHPPQAAATVAAVAATEQTLDYAAIIKAHRDCPSIQAVGDSGLNLQLVPFSNMRVLCDTKGCHPRPVILLGHCYQVFYAFHGMAHPGAKATRRIMSQRVIWYCMSKDVTQWVKNCQACSRAKVTRQPAATLQPQPILVPQQRFSHIHVENLGPLLVSREGFRYLFTIIDRSSRMLEAVPLANIKTETCRYALIIQWMSRFSIPAHLMSNQGAQFTSALWACLCDVIGTHHNTTTAYHLQSNGMVKRAHRGLKEALKSRTAAADWPQHLPWVLLDINNAPKEDTGKLAAQMVYGTSLTLPAQMDAGDKLPVDKILRNLSTATTIVLTCHSQKEVSTEPPAALASENLVYVRKGGQLQLLAQLYSNPYKVLESGERIQVLPPGHRQ
jgi:hypothetical protein